ncbi:hypothetical protein [Iodobacter sp.]|uniref:hypothetical protein n=1 Tax=Iodobacter sp. TaxID=1915058 RepID=UPI0025E5B9FB|nr:hypothetical protein [Iodobacter sp.]
MQRDLAIGSKIMVIGCSGSGKSTLARKLAKQLKIIDIDLDSLYWQANWTPSEPDKFRSEVNHAIKSSPSWVIHGGYHQVKDLTWGNADTVIFLDYSRAVVMWRVIKRSIARAINKEVLWNGNTETMVKNFLSKDSIILWAWNSYAIRKSQFNQFIADPKYKHIKLLQFKRSADLERFLADFLP